MDGRLEDWWSSEFGVEGSDLSFAAARKKKKKVKGRITVLSHSEAFQINQRLILRNSRNNTSLLNNTRHLNFFIIKADYEFWRR